MLPVDLVKRVNHVLPAGPHRDLLVEFASEIQRLKTKVFCGGGPPPKSNLSEVKSDPGFVPPKEGFSEDDCYPPEKSKKGK